MIRTELKQIKSRLTEIQNDLGAPKINNALHKGALLGSTIIKKRTVKGMGINTRLRPYSPKYAQMKRTGWKATKSRPSFSGDSSGVVNLTVSGEMLNAMTGFKGNLESYVGFTSSTEAKKALGNHQTRRFFGFSAKERSEIRNRIKTILGLRTNR